MPQGKRSCDAKHVSNCFTSLHCLALTHLRLLLLDSAAQEQESEHLMLPQHPSVESAEQVRCHAGAEHWLGISLMKPSLSLCGIMAVLVSLLQQPTFKCLFVQPDCVLVMDSGAKTACGILSIALQACTCWQVKLLYLRKSKPDFTV